MGVAVATVLFFCAVALMVIVGWLIDHRGNHTVSSFLVAVAAILLIFASAMSLFVFK